MIAFANGALAHVVEPGRTGFLVGSVEEMARAIGICGGLDSSACRAAARARFSERRMIAEYLALYERLARREPHRIMVGRR